MILKDFSYIYDLVWLAYPSEKVVNHFVSEEVDKKIVRLTDASFNLDFILT